MKLKKRIAALLMAGATGCSALPVKNSSQNAGGLCEHHSQHTAECACETLCTEESVNADCTVCEPEDADLKACKGELTATGIFYNCFS